MRYKIKNINLENKRSRSFKKNVFVEGRRLKLGEAIIVDERTLVPLSGIVAFPGDKWTGQHQLYAEPLDDIREAAKEPAKPKIDPVVEPKIAAESDPISETVTIIDEIDPVVEPEPEPTKTEVKVEEQPGCVDGDEISEEEAEALPLDEENDPVQVPKSKYSREELEEKVVRELNDLIEIEELVLPKNANKQHKIDALMTILA